MTVVWRLAPAPLMLAAFGFQAPGGGDTIPQPMLVKKNPVAISNSLLAKARDNFSDNCLPCHGAEGKGDGPLSTSLDKKPKDLTSAKELAVMTDGEIFWTITRGRKPMPAFDQKLTDEERWGLVHLVRNISHTKPNNTALKSSGAGLMKLRLSEESPSLKK